MPQPVDLLADSDAFEVAVRQALEHIHDFVALRPTALAQLLVPGATELDRGAACADRLSKVLERLKPLSDDQDDWVNMRYRLLYARYIEGRKSEDAASHLSISRRHFFRLLGRAVSEYAAVLLTEVGNSDPQGVEPDIKDSSGHVIVPPGRQGAIGEIVSRIHGMLSPRLRERGVELSIQATDTLSLQVDRELVRQVIMGVIGQYVAYGATEIAVSVREVHRSAQLRVQCLPEDTEIPNHKLDECLGLARTNGIKAHISHQGRSCTLDLSERQRLVLIADDEERACRLLCRYLGIAGYRTMTAKDGTTAVALAREHRPDAITLDLMMGGEDGWDVLQQLTMGSETSAIPVLVCSALDQKELALLMGAKHFVRKPIARDELLCLLTNVC